MKPTVRRALERRDATALIGAALMLALTGWPAHAGTAASASLFGPVQALDDALIAAMRSGNTASFNQRYSALQPVIDRVFNLNVVLAESVGLSWTRIADTQKATLAAAFRRYIVASYAANFDSYDGQKFEILPNVRMLEKDEAVVQTRLLRLDKAPVRLDYVMRSGPSGWQVVDVLTDGTISRVAVQRSDFRQLLESGGVPALTAGLKRKVASLAGSMQG